MGRIFDALLKRAWAAPNSAFCTLVRGTGEVMITSSYIVLSASGIGRALQHIGVPEHSITIIVLEHSECMYAAFMGAIFAGAVPSFVPPLTRKQDPDTYMSFMKALLQRIRPSIIINSEKESNSIPANGTPMLLLETVHSGDLESVRLHMERTARIDNGDIRIEDHPYKCTAAVLRPGLSDVPFVIEYGAVVGMGAVVTRDIPPMTTVVGNPAQPLQRPG